MKKTLTFETTIQAPRARVWSTLIEPDTYSAWTAAFSEGSRFEGSWDQGAKIRFLGPSGDGMLAEIAENRPQEYVSIRHVGMIEKGVEDTASEKVRAWTPAYETYRLVDVPDGTRVTVTLDTPEEYAQHMQDTFPKALAQLKDLAEKQAA